LYQSVTLGDKLPNVTLKLQSNQPFGTIYRTDHTKTYRNYHICSYVSRTRPNIILFKVAAWRIRVATVSVRSTPRKHVWWFATAHIQGITTARHTFAWLCMLFHSLPSPLGEPSRQCWSSNDVWNGCDYG